MAQQTDKSTEAASVLAKNGIDLQKQGNLCVSFPSSDGLTSRKSAHNATDTHSVPNSPTEPVTQTLSHCDSMRKHALCLGNHYLIINISTLLSRHHSVELHKRSPGYHHRANYPQLLRPWASHSGVHSTATQALRLFDLPNPFGAAPGLIAIVT